ncbi:hypothetical protein [Cellulomonas pakistanensis]|nr:hypothetical protein [Cellulomonas pakistanensis]
MAAGTVGAAVAQAAPALGTAEWLAEFLLSPGPAALAAVLAAVLGLVAARARIRADRAVAEDARRGAERAAAVAHHAQVVERNLAQWWEAYTWVTARLGGADDEAFRPVLKALATAADDPVRSALATVAWEQISEREGAEP